MASDTLNSRHHKGYAGELRAASWFAQAGFEVYFPAFHQGPVDFIVASGTDITRVQVKTPYWTVRPHNSYLQVTVRKGCGDGREYNSYTKEDTESLSSPTGTRPINYDYLSDDAWWEMNQPGVDL